MAEHDATGRGRVRLGRQFRIGSATVYRWIVERARFGSISPKTGGRRGPKPKIPDEQLAELIALVAEKSDRTLKELCDAWFTRVQVLVDEAMTPTMARAPVGERAITTVPPMRASNVSVAAAIRQDEVIAWFPHDGAVNEERFVAFIANKVAPRLHTGDVVVMDNMKFHKGPEIKAIVEKAGARILFIPAYHPELNAIEEACSVVENAVRRMEPRTICPGTTSP